MARPDKAAAVDELVEQFTNSNAAVLTDYRGLTVKELKELRRSLGADATYAVAKNTLARVAAQKAGIEGLDEQLVGPTAIAFINGDVATVTKSLRDFAKAQPLLILKGGVMDGNILDADKVKKLADLESREVLLSKLAGAMKATAQTAISTFAAPLTKAAQTFGALAEKAEGDPSVIGGAGTPAPAAASDAAASADDQKPEPAADDAATAADAAPADQAGESTDAAPAASND